MIEYLLSIDPGKSTGIALLEYGDGYVSLEGVWQFGGGAASLKGWVEEHWRESGWDDYNDEPKYGGLYPWKVGISEFLTTEYRTESNPNYVEDDPRSEWLVDIPPNLTVIAEKFTARNTKGFSYTTDSLEALRGEGVLLAKDLMPDYTPKEKRWVDPKFQYLVGGKDLPDKKKRQHAFLEDTGFYIGRKEIGETLPDYNDARSATAHGIAYLARVKKHRPSWDLIEGWTNGN